MEDHGNNGLESAAIFMLSGDPILPATITFVNIPDYEYSGSGSISLEGSSETFCGITKEIESSWSILGVFDSGFSSEWGVGEGEYHWYRIEGSCGETRCDTAGVKYNTCRNMTFVTVVGARNLSELCGKLANPVLNPKVDFKLSSIKKYSRPITRSESEDCNELTEQDYCQIAECLDYCIDQDVKQIFSFSMRAIESDHFVEMSGGIRLFGQVQTDRNKQYEPEFPVIGLSGTSVFLVSIHHEPASGQLSTSGSSDFISSFYRFESSGEGVGLEGFARTISPDRKYSDMEGGLEFYGGARTYYSPSFGGSLDVSGDAESFLRLKFEFVGKVELSGRIVDYVSPTFLMSGSGSVAISGSSSFNFENYGSFVDDFGFGMRAFDLASEASELSYSSELTISKNQINPSCGCGPVGLALNLRHNLSNSSFISAFVRRTGMAFVDSVLLRYRSSDSSWRSAQSFSGKGRDGLSQEDLSMFYSISCSEDLWQFSFNAISINRTTNDQRYSKFIVDIPSDLLCSDGNIASVMEMDINSGVFSFAKGKAISAVTPARPISPNPFPRKADFFVDGVFNEKRLYYDGIGIFKNKYWEKNPLRMTINLPPREQTSGIELHKIFS